MKQKLVFALLNYEICWIKNEFHHLFDGLAQNHWLYLKMAGEVTILCANRGRKTNLLLLCTYVAYQSHAK